MPYVFYNFIIFVKIISSSYSIVYVKQDCQKPYETCWGRA